MNSVNISSDGVVTVSAVWAEIGNVMVVVVIVVVVAVVFVVVVFIVVFGGVAFVLFKLLASYDGEVVSIAEVTI